MLDVLEGDDPRRVGRYRIVARIGAGGMGQVYLGRSPGGRPVAVKVVRPELAGDGDFRRRFAREVAAARRVNGAFTAGVVDADPEGSPAWLATVYVSGVPLGEAVARHGPWPEASVLALGAGLAEALEAIHAAGVVHRDLKPSNVLLAADGPRVIDFGISSASEASALTRTGTTIGTPGFMSPEQLTGRPVGPQSDVFSLGAVLAYTAAGVGPFGTGTPHALHFRAVYEQPDLDALPQDLRGIVAACLAKEPERRPTVADLLHRMTVRGEGESPEAALLPAEPGWMPDPVRQLVREQAADAVPHTPTPTVPDVPAGPSAAQPTPTVDDPAPGIHLAPTRTAAAGPAPAPANTPADTPADPGRPTPAPPVGAPLSRRGALLALTGTAAAAGTALVAWKLSDSGSGSAGSPSAGKPTTPAPVRTTTTPPPVREPGRQIWAFRTDDEVHTAAAVANGVVYFGSNDKNLYAVDAATGRKRWAFPTSNVVYSSPAVANGVVYFGSHDDVLYALDAASGRKRWAFPTGRSVDGPPLVVGDVVYVGGNDETLYAVDTATGTKRWSFRCRKGGTLTSKAVAAGGLVYFGSWDKHLYALDAATGKKRWDFAAPDLMSHAPAVAGGLVYITSNRLYALNAATGTQRWVRTGRKYSIPGAGYRSFLSPAVSGGVVYVGDEIQNLYALDAATGDQRWVFRTEGSVFSTPAVAGGVVYFGSEDKSLYAVDTATGKKRWAFPTGGEIDSPVTLAGGVAYVGSKDGTMYAVKI